MAEPDVVVERHIAAEPEQLWAMVADVTRMGEWSPETVGGRWVGGATGPAVGARFRGKNQIGVRRWSTTCTVTEAEPGRSFVFRVHSGPLEVAEWGYRFEPADGGCRARETFTDRRGGIIRALGRLVTGVGDRPGHNRAGMEETLSRLAGAAEGAPA
jgi:uncharacterized protein YndB with AHSA1/START domain